MKNAHDLVGEMFGVRVSEREFPDATDADTAVKVLARRNPRRVALTVINLSANTVVIAPFAGVSTTRGIQIPPNGGNFVVNVRDDFLLPSREWSVVASADNSAIYVLETIIEQQGPEELGQ